MANIKENLERLANGDHEDPFSLLGPHTTAKQWLVRSFQPHAEKAVVLDPDGKQLATMKRAHPSGIFEARIPLPQVDYRLRLVNQGGSWEVQDPYRFTSPLGEMDRYLMGEGTHWRLYDRLGAHVIEHEGVTGVHFAVWAPSARRVSVVGPFNDWDGRRHPLRNHPGNGVWDIFIPELRAGEIYKFEIKGPHGEQVPLKTDPYARAMEPPPGNASIVHHSEYHWQDQEWMATRSERNGLDRPMAIYEVHLGSWRRHADGNRWLSYRELAESLVSYLQEMNYTHVELLPPTEHPFDGSWGYQPIGMFAPTWRFGSPDDFKHFVDCCHRSEIGVIIDWVPAHFPRDSHGLGFFDGTHLYEHADPRQGAHQDWGTLIFNFGRREVVNYLLANALFWLEEYHVDALRVDAVASMLYLDYSREPGQWVPNQYGGNENLEAVAFLRRLNELVHEHGGVTMAEESTSWPMVSRPTYLGGLGFSYKWNMGWMNDTLNYMHEDPVHRLYHHDRLTFSFVYAFSENFILPLSHDEVVHGKGSMLTRMPGDTWQKFANVRLYYTYMYAHPGKKLLFMGNEFAQGREWNHAAALDWSLLEIPWHAGVQRLVRDLNRLYVYSPPLHQVDFSPAGFDWIDGSDAAHSVIAFLRRAADSQDFLVAVFNFTPLPRHGYRIGVPAPGRYQELINSDGSDYCGSGVGNMGEVTAEPIETHGRPWSVNLTLPPLGALLLKPETDED